ncbi:hypothetical protein D3C76_1725930 [compost metagenome]
MGFNLVWYIQREQTIGYMDLYRFHLNKGLSLTFQLRCPSHGWFGIVLKLSKEPSLVDHRRAVIKLRSLSSKGKPRLS